MRFIFSRSYASGVFLMRRGLVPTQKTATVETPARGWTDGWAWGVASGRVFCARARRLRLCLAWEVKPGTSFCSSLCFRVGVLQSHRMGSAGVDQEVALPAPSTGGSRFQFVAAVYGTGQQSSICPAVGQEVRAYGTQQGLRPLLDRGLPPHFKS
jgi:hypothetical protein